MKIEVLKAVSSANDTIATENRKLLQKHKVIMINIMSSPGAGKTSLLLNTIENLRGKLNLAVIEGDIASSIDSEKVSRTGTPVLQINTGGNCSLEAHMISSALQKLSLKDIDILFVENVGNLICPAENNLGEMKKVVISSIPEGDDKPLKYPVIFSKTDAVIINKIDLLPYVEFNLEFFRKTIKGINPNVTFFEISCKTGEGIDIWCRWLEKLTEGSRK